MKSNDNTPLMVRYLDAFCLWLADGRCVIRDKNGNLVPLKPNFVQEQIISRMYQQARRNRPIYLLIPKARKMGVSTLMQAFLYFLAANVPQWESRTLSHRADDTKLLWKISETIHDNAPPTGGEFLTTSCTWKGHGADFKCQTAGGKGAGRGGTPFGVHLSEIALYNQTKADLDTAIMSSMATSMPQGNPATVLALESTGQGPTGEFHSRCVTAQKENDDSLIFFPWFHDPENRMDPADAPWEPDKSEEVLRARGLDEEQLAWRRFQINRKFNNNLIQFQREYPATLDEAFCSSEGRVYPWFGRDTHVSDMDIDDAELYRGIDWGGTDPFVCLWVAFFPKLPTGFSVSEDCHEAIQALQAYSWKKPPAVDTPDHQHSHIPDALRYIIVTFLNDQNGHVHLYRCIHEPDHARSGKSLTQLMEQIHVDSGWTEVSAGQWIAGPGAEVFEGTVADRQRIDSIRELNDRGIPAIGQTNIASANKTKGVDTRGEVVQGIDKVAKYINATHPASAEPMPKSDYQVALDDMRRSKRASIRASIPIEQDAIHSLVRDIQYREKLDRRQKQAAARQRAKAKQRWR